VLAISLTASLLGWALLALLERVRAPDARRMWTFTAVVVFVLSLFGPLTVLLPRSSAPRSSCCMLSWPVCSLLGCAGARDRRGVQRWPRTTSRGVLRVRAHPLRRGAP